MQQVLAITWEIACASAKYPDITNYKLGAVVQGATDVLEVGKEAIERQVTSEVEGTLLTLQHTYRETSSIYRTVSKGVKGKVEVGTYTSEIEGTLKCKSKNRDPYILLRVVCAHMVRAP